MVKSIAYSLPSHATVINSDLCTVFLLQNSVTMLVEANKLALMQDLAQVDAADGNLLMKELEVWLDQVFQESETLLFKFFQVNHQALSEHIVEVLYLNWLWEHFVQACSGCF